MRLPTERRKTHNIVENGTSSDTFYPVLGCSFAALNRLGYSIVSGSTEAQFTMTRLWFNGGSIYHDSITVQDADGSGIKCCHHRVKMCTNLYKSEAIK